jgi:hypothetical protein
MGDKPLTACKGKSALCSGYAVERGYCAECAKENPKRPDDNLRHKRKAFLLYDKASQAFYQTSQWRYRTQPTMMAYNQPCQFLVDGTTRCLHPPKFVHHIRSPKTHPELGHKPENLVCLCDLHHPPTEGDDPLNPRAYVPTRFRSAPGLPIEEFAHPQPKPSSPADTGAKTVRQTDITEPMSTDYWQAFFARQDKPLL